MFIRVSLKSWAEHTDPTATSINLFNHWVMDDRIASVADALKVASEEGRKTIRYQVSDHTKKHGKEKMYGNAREIGR